MHDPAQYGKLTIRPIRFVQKAITIDEFQFDHSPILILDFGDLHHVPCRLSCHDPFCLH
jgi:hypothetical protein